MLFFGSNLLPRVAGISVLTLTGLLRLTSLAAGAPGVRVVGSDLALPALESALRAKPGAEQSGVALQLEGSRRGLAELRNGHAQIGILAFVPGEEIPEKEFRLIPLAYQIVVIAVPSANPLRQVSFPQLAALFGEKEATSIRQWGALVQQNGWANRAVALQIVSRSDSLGVGLFRYTVLHFPQFKTTAAFQSDMRDALARLRVDDNAIALLPGIPDELTGIQLLRVAVREGEPAFGPTADNVHAGDYPLRLPFFIAFRADRSRELQGALKFLLGDDVASGLAARGFLPVPANARQQTLRELAAH